MRAFLLVRDEDETGISGTGIVAEGIEFSDGRIAMRWVSSTSRSTVTWDSARDAITIHGHNGKTRMVFSDDIVWPHEKEAADDENLRTWKEELSPEGREGIAAATSHIAAPAVYVDEDPCLTAGEHIKYADHRLQECPVYHQGES